MATNLPNTIKHRALVFTDNPTGQVDRAIALLTRLDGVRVERTDEPNCLHVSYSLLDYSLEMLDGVLTGAGLQLADSALGQIGKKLTYYQEEVEYHNLNVPEPERHARTRKSEVFVKAYEHHLHGDHDDTPPELREYK